MRHVFDWLDRFTGYDRDTKRFLLVIVAINAVIFSTLAYDMWLKEAFWGPECDIACQNRVDRFIQDNPDLFRPLPTVDVDEIIRDVLNDSPTDSRGAN